MVTLELRYIHSYIKLDCMRICAIFLLICWEIDWNITNQFGLAKGDIAFMYQLVFVCFIMFFQGFDFSYGDSCYKLVQFPLDWNRARRTCQQSSSGADLVDILDRYMTLCDIILSPEGFRDVPWGTLCNQKQPLKNLTQHAHYNIYLHIFMNWKGLTVLG